MMCVLFEMRKVRSPRRGSKPGPSMAAVIPFKNYSLVSIKQTVTS